MDSTKCTGLAIYFPQSKETFKFRISNIASIFTGEAQALLLSIQIISLKQIKNSIIFTDSRSVLEAIKNYSPLRKNNTSHLVLEIISLLYYCKTNNLNTKLVWIPSHSNITNNDKVDHLAKEAIINGTDLSILLPYTDFLESVNLYVKNLQKDYLAKEATQKGILYFTHYYTPNSKKPWFNNSRLSRFHIVSLNRVRSNHYSLAASMYRKNITQSPDCTCGDTYQDFEHILWHCPKHNSARISLKSKVNHYCSKKKINTTPTTTDILKYPNQKLANFLTEFLKKCDLQI